MNDVSEPVSFSLRPDIPLSGLPWYKDTGLSIQEYKVKKSDILAAPNAILRKGKGTDNEQEVIIRGTDVTKVSPDAVNIETSKRGDVTKTGLLNQARANPLDIQDVVLGGAETKFSKWQLPGGEDYRVSFAAVTLTSPMS